MTALKPAAFRATVGILAILLFSYIALLATVNSARFQEWLKIDLAERTGYEVAAGQLWLDPLLRLTLTAVTASKASKPVLQAHRISVTFSPMELFSKTIHRLRLEKPTLILDLNELMQATKEPALDISIRHLNIEDGALVLKLDSGNSVDFRSLAMNAENVNLGQATGLNLRADVPWLQGVGEVLITGDGKEKLAKVRVEQPPSKALRNLVQPKQRAPDALEAEIKLSKKDDESLRIAAIGKLNGMMMEGEEFSGHFDLRAALGANRKEADVDANIVATELPPQMRFLPIALPKGTTTLVLEGNFVTADKKLELRSFRLQSPLGDASGTGQVEFIPEVTFSKTKVSLRKVPLGARPKVFASQPGKRACVRWASRR